MEGVNREGSFGVDFSFLLPGDRTKSWASACRWGSLWALGKQCSPYCLTAARSPRTVCNLRSPHPVPEQCGERGHPSGVAHGLFFTQGSPAGIFSGLLDKVKEYEQLLCFCFQRKNKTKTKKKPKPKGLVNQTLSCWNLSKRDHFHLPWKLLVSWALAFGLCLSCVTSEPCLAMACTDLSQPVGQGLSMTLAMSPVHDQVLSWACPAVTCSSQLPCPFTWSSFSLLSRSILLLQEHWVSQRLQIMT